MKNAKIQSLLAMTAGITIAGHAGAANIDIGNPAPGNQAADLISVDTVWTKNNVYNLRSQIYVVNGATLTIEAGTVIASTPTVDGAGSIAVTRGSKIIANGTCDEPIIFTTTNDVATWDVDASHPTGKNPKTGTWRAAANEWGNITILGNAYVSNTIDVASNQPFCDAGNFSPMEGLIPEVANDPNTIFGGGFDNDDSGSLKYVSLRYGGRVVGFGDELNGLSLGGVGRATDIEYIDIMNNIDDGIEIWGGTVNLKYISIWNIGDDSLDVDQGWRGKAQFGLIVQGYNAGGSQGSGTGDNLIEADGAEKADAQPVTTVTLYNFTLIGQPIPGSGDHALAYRDGARLQFRNGIIMDIGDKIVGPDWSDFEGSLGYGASGTLTFAQTWTTPYTSTSLVNACVNPQNRYQAQSQGTPGIGQGFLNEITDTVFFRNLNNSYSVTPNGANAIPDADELGADQVGVTIAGGSNAAKANIVAAYLGAGNPNANMPITALTRSATPGPLNMLRVTGLDPRPANAALVSSASAPAGDNFFVQANYRGAFAPGENWLCNWTAADAYGMVIEPRGGCSCPEQPVACLADTVTSATLLPPPDGVVDGADLAFLIGEWGPGPSIADIVTNATIQPPPDGVVDGADLAYTLGEWGTCGE